MKKLAAYVAIALATVTAVFILYQFRAIVGLFALSLVTTAALRPLVDRLSNGRLPRMLAIGLVYAAILCLLIALLLIVSDSLAGEIQSLSDSLAAAYEQAYPHWLEGKAYEQLLANRLPPPDQLYEALTGTEGELIIQRLLGLTLGVVGLAGGVMLVLVISVYWTVDRVSFERLWLSLLPVGQRIRARAIWRNTEQEIGAYVRSEAIQALAAILILGLGYWLMGLSYPTLLAIIGGIAWLIPIVGVVFALGAVVVFTLEGGLALTVGASLFTLAVLVLLEFVVEPRFLKRRRFSPILAILVMFILAQEYGIIGLVIGPPLAATLQITLGQLLRRRVSARERDPDKQLANLRQRLKQVQNRIEAMDRAESPELDSLTVRLNALVEQAEKAA
jgi:putative permease